MTLKTRKSIWEKNYKPISPRRRVSEYVEYDWGIQVMMEDLETGEITSGPRVMAGASGETNTGVQSNSELREQEQQYRTATGTNPYSLIP